MCIRDSPFIHTACHPLLAHRAHVDSSAPMRSCSRRSIAMVAKGDFVQQTMQVVQEHKQTRLAYFCTGAATALGRSRCACKDRISTLATASSDAP
eukprot:410138-Pleurochrysis_carterae.AAC.1